MNKVPEIMPVPGEPDKVMWRCPCGIWEKILKRAIKLKKQCSKCQVKHSNDTKMAKIRFRQYKPRVRHRKRKDPIYQEPKHFAFI